MESQTITIDELANYKFNKEEHRQLCTAYRVLFNEDFYNKACDKAFSMLK